MEKQKKTFFLFISDFDKKKRIKKQISFWKNILSQSKLKFFRWVSDGWMDGSDSYITT